MLSWIEPNDLCVALDVNGKSWSTLQLSQQLQQWQSTQQVCLLIGGPEGLSDACKQRANQLWSLSALTLPHPLVRGLYWLSKSTVLTLYCADILIIENETMSSRTCQLAIFTGLALLLAACSTTHHYSAESIQQTKRDGAPNFHVNVDKIPNAKPHYLPQSKYGNPESYVVKGKRYFTRSSAKGFRQRGIASWYGTQFHSRLTSSGEKYNMLAMTAAHKTLPLPTFVRVTNLDNGKSVIVKVNDRGPFKKGRVIDLSYAAAKKLDMTKTGTAPVEIIALPPFNSPRADRYSLPYLVQYAAFKNKQNAIRYRRLLQNKTRFNNLFIDRINGLYTVRSGPYQNAKLANKAARQAKWLGYDKAYILQQRDQS